MDHNTLSGAPAWPEMSTDLSSARAAARTITLDTARASDDGRLIDLTRKLDQLGIRIDGIEQDALNNRVGAEVAEELTAEFSTIRRELGGTRAEFEQLSHRVASTEEDLSTSMLQTIDGFEQRIAKIEDDRLHSGDDVGEVMEILESALGRIQDLDARISAIGEDQFTTSAELLATVGDLVGEVTELKAHVGALSDPAAVIEHHAERLDDVDTKLETVATDIAFLKAHAENAPDADPRVDEINELTNDAVALVADVAIRVDAQDAHIAAATESLSQIEVQTGEVVGRVDEALENIDALDSQVHDHTTRIDHTHERIDGTIGRLDELAGRVDGAAAATNETVERIDAAHHRLDETGERIDESHGRIHHVDNRVNETHGRIDDVHARIDAIEQSTSDLDRAAATDERHEALSAQLDETTSRLGETSGRIDETNQRLSETTEQVNSTTARLDETVGRVNGAHEHLGAVDQRLTDGEAQMGELSRLVDAGTERINGLESAHQAITARVEQLENGDEPSASATELEKYTIRLDDISERAVLAEKRVDDLAQQSTEQNERIAGIEATVTDDVEGRDQRLLERIDEARARLAEQEQATADLRDELSETASVLSKQISQVADRPAESSVVDDARIDEIEASVARAEGLASEAHEFSESLRQLQTELVQAIQTEIRGQSARITDAESKLEDTLRTVSQLSDMQGRSTSVDAQLTDSVVTTNEHVDATNVEVAKLHGLLEAAVARIDELERHVADLSPAADPRLAALAGDVTPPESETTPTASVGDLVGMASEDDVDEDDWFVASYVEKKKKRFGR